MPYKVNQATGEVESAAGRDLPAEIFTDLDRLDDDQIVAELKGGVIEEYVYSFPQGGTNIVGLSWVGAREAARHYQGIHVGEPKISQDDDSYTIMVQVTDRMRDLVLWGAACVSKKMKRRDGTTEPDVFAFNKALSKAQRNGLIAVLPTAVIVKTIQAFLDAKKGVRQVNPTNGSVQAGTASPKVGAPLPVNQGEPRRVPSRLEKLRFRWTALWREATVDLALDPGDLPSVKADATEGELVEAGKKLGAIIVEARADLPGGGIEATESE